MFQKCRKLFRNERKVSKFSQETTPRIRRSSQGGCGRSNISCISISFLVLKFLEKAKFVYRPHRCLWSSFYTLSHRFLVNGWVTGIIKVRNGRPRNLQRRRNQQNHTEREKLPKLRTSGNVVLYLAIIQTFH